MVTATKKSKKGEKSIFRTNFKVHAIDRTEDPNDPSKRIISKKFEAVSRLEGKSDEGCSIVLDYQSELISLAEGDKVEHSTQKHVLV
ncbi:hypothetical protein SARC_10538 [Sphaeroforma arctica JP610]|uniref:Uncharacterized protein n=1 Tax=Sphaeroforma arctica JP610 TaxID=667725 RepID=A0A0L0FJN2_9EUKA|nr:hypothetical protein SARC_10538 [Sphaeroforma arctica JP610]KNC76989.1 hypothetical protein SARC_10538 [Sphaeroforma arctica JP610]|eukprot:XP_014150891.1 hypothetical protein SARC_10538 [Sphaeroforma arctica JP610]